MRSMLRLLAPGFVLAAAALAAAQQPPAEPLTQEQKTEVLKGINQVIAERAFVPGVDFGAWEGFVAKRAEAIAAAQDANAFTAEINRALREFGFSHIRLLSPRAAAQRGQTSRVGSGGQFSPRQGGGLLVGPVREGTPAHDAGLKMGDVILKVNGSDAANPTQMNGEDGQEMKLVVKTGEGPEREATLKIRTYSTVRPETLSWVDDKTAHLRIFTFSNGYDRANIEKLLREAAPADRLILDLRSNGGGAVSNLNHLLSLLLPHDTAYGSFVSRRLFQDFVKANPDTEPTLNAIAEWNPSPARTRRRSQPPFQGQIAVLINRGSASASEITAAALMELAGAKLVGSRTAGAVLASTFARLPEGFSMQHPVSDYLTVKLRRLEGQPLMPDLEVAAGGEGDVALAKAAELLRELAQDPPQQKKAA
jgi:carboxyl-terminal processing protease